MWGRHAEMIARMAAGPIAMAAFLLPWGHGPGMLAATEFTGMDLIRFTGHVQSAETAWWQVWLALTGRAAAVVFAVAAAWHTLLAPAWRWHAAYRLTGGYLVAAAAAILTAAAIIEGVGIPSAGGALAAVAALLFLGAEAATLARRGNNAGPGRGMCSSPAIGAAASGERA